ncbi:hypothetical protein SCLCIDRAFT_20736 [Scleroderma citrinum Foug A]|uniref:Uncharacterized protein n=1 Tax=Scleroderma citrinum Foug A TaxID=1036808 RepID=A0A0C3EIG1_9AGAM|nr:hypothetical protein SCLCIDRAFT_20736 [Scleroderma citrinum Foug A]
MQGEERSREDVQVAESGRRRSMQSPARLRRGVDRAVPACSNREPLNRLAGSATGTWISALHSQRTVGRIDRLPIIDPINPPLAAMADPFSPDNVTIMASHSHSVSSNLPPHSDGSTHAICTT